jgi:holo-ACP synthase/triphosphoribosyl-dephospho-CoA synthase
MLEAREMRAFRQFALSREFGKPLVSFSMNIPGPVKDSPLIRRGFRAGCAALEHRLPKGKVLHREMIEAVTGCEAIYVLDMEPIAVKAITTAIEDDHGLGRLFDMDVIGTDLCKLDREAVGGGDRNCIVCGAPGRGCASRRVHSVEDLQAATRRILEGCFRERDAILIGNWATQSLLDEVCTTPKPGLVDRRNPGSHADMDIFTFMASAAALHGYFIACAKAGMEPGCTPAETFTKLRRLGLRAEQDMYAATGGVNTHKGAVFTIGILCGAAGRLWKEGGIWNAEEIFREVSAMTVEAMEADFRKSGDTVGYRLYAANGTRGIRGEVAEGLPSVANLGLPVYRACRNKGMDKNDAGVHTLLTLVANVRDTNMLKRGGPDLARAAAEKCAGILSGDYCLGDVEALDDWFMERNLSPGGCADLLAITYFLYELCEKQKSVSE